MFDNLMLTKQLQSVRRCQYQSCKPVLRARAAENGENASQVDASGIAKAASSLASADKQEGIRAKLRMAAEYKRKVQASKLNKAEDGGAVAVPLKPAQTVSTSAAAPMPLENAIPPSKPLGSQAASTEAGPSESPAVSTALLQALRSDAATSKPSSSATSFLDAIEGAQVVGSPQVAATPAMSRRTEDEEIRADRQQRMAAMGLSGAPASAWTDEEVDRVASSASEDEPTPSSDADASAAEFAVGTGKAMSAEEALLSPEQYTLRKEAQTQMKGADVISVEREYKPKVTTWGVFERPRDISKAYGGGRQLKPSDSVMTKEEQAAYDEQLRAKLAALRGASSEFTASPETVYECERLTQQGAQLMQRGALREALTTLDRASSMLSPKTEAGGMAVLQKAIALDSLGEHEKALTLYRQLHGHRSAYISKTARTMSFGFKAGDFLKADTISYAVKKEEMDPFFTQLNGRWGWDTVYVPTEEEKTEASGASKAITAFATLVMLSPFLFLAKLIIAR